jgi:hypothetical protein
MLTPKYTGIAVFVAPVVAPYVRLLGMYKHSFGASEGSKGGVGVALGLYDVTAAFVNVHMASKRPDLRRQQYQELIDRLGSKLGGRGFGLNESFHHIIWMGDLNVHCSGISAADALNLIRTGRHMQLLLQHDELLLDKDNETFFYEYEEPIMGPRFFPTYKKLPGRGQVNTNDPDWVRQVYVTAFREPFYKGGRVMERVPSWTDRIQYHSLPDKWGELLPEPLDPTHPDTSIHNYHAVNDALDGSDHSAIFATFGLQICAEEVDEKLEAYVEAAQAQVGYRQAEAGRPLGDEDGPGGMDRSMDEGAAGPGGVRQLPPVGPAVEGVVDFSSLHPSLRPLQVDISLYGIMVEHKGVMVVPRAVSTVFPLPYEDSHEIPDRRKVARESSFPFFSRGQESIGVSMRTIVSRANRLESLHLLLKISLDDNTKAQCVIALKDGGFTGAGTHVNTFMQPLIAGGVPLKSGGKPATVTFTMEMNAYERGGTQMAQPTAPVTARPHNVAGMRRGGAGAGASDSEGGEAMTPEYGTGASAAPALTPAPPARSAPAAPAPTPGYSSAAQTPMRPQAPSRPPVAVPPSAASGSATARGPSSVSSASAPSPAQPATAETARMNVQKAMMDARARAAANARPPGSARPGAKPGISSSASSVGGDDNGSIAGDRD